MFGELLESRARRARNRAGMVASLIGHGAFIALAVIATRTPLTARISDDERIVPLPVLPPNPRPSVPMRTPARTTGEPTRDGSVNAPLFEPIDVAMPIDPIVEPLTSPVIDAGWDATPAPGRRARPTGGDGVIHGEAIPFGVTVEKPAMALGGNPVPLYPDILRRAGVRGEVTVEVVVDTSGMAQMGTLRVIATDHPLLTDAVVTAMRRARFLPAETGGRKVRMWVRQSFVFEVR